MKKIKLSLGEKRCIKAIILFIIIQLFIIFSFLLLVSGSQQIDINNTKQIEITVDDVHIIRVPKEDWLFVIADSTYYLFTGRATNEDYSVHELYNSISKGDSLSLRYYELDTVLLKNINKVVDARNETEIYRNIEEYNYGRHGVDIFVVILCSIIEIIFIGIVIIYCWINFNVIKNFYKKKHRLNGKCK